LERQLHREFGRLRASKLPRLTSIRRWGARGLPDLDKTSVAKLRALSGSAFLGLALLLVGPLPSPAAIVQAPSSGKPAHSPNRSYRRPSLDDRVKTLARNLNLNKAQQTAVKKILEDRQQEVLRLRTDPLLSGADRIARFRALQTETVEEIRSVLNEEQKKKYDPLAPRKIPPGSHAKSVEEWIDSTTPKK
jgi:hypothetical protein